MSTSLRSVDMIFLGLTIHYVYLLTIWHLYNVIRYLSRNVAERKQLNLNMLEMPALAHADERRQSKFVY